MAVELKSKYAGSLDTFKSRRKTLQQNVELGGVRRVPGTGGRPERCKRGQRWKEGAVGGGRARPCRASQAELPFMESLRMALSRGVT